MHHRQDEKTGVLHVRLGFPQANNNKKKKKKKKEKKKSSNNNNNNNDISAILVSFCFRVDGQVVKACKTEELKDMAPSDLEV